MLDDAALDSDLNEDEVPEEKPKRGRGRPKGSKNRRRTEDE